MNDIGGIPPDWYRESFGRLYLTAYEHRDRGRAAEEISSLLALLDLPPQARILDLCCGAGRHLEALLRSGVRAVGLDLSQALLQAAAGRVILAGRVVRGEIRRLPFDAAFDCVLNLFSSFGYFAREKDNEKALEEMARVLKPGGLLVLDHMNRLRVEKTLVARSERKLKDGALVEERRISGNRVEKRITFFGRDGAAKRSFESVRLYEPEELSLLLRAKGLKETGRWGNFRGDPLTGESERMILAARKEEA